MISMPERSALVEGLMMAPKNIGVSFPSNCMEPIGVGVSRERIIEAVSCGLAKADRQQSNTLVFFHLGYWLLWIHR